MTRRPEIRAMQQSDVEAAGRLLAVRHVAHRRAEPLLGARFEDPETAAAEVAAALAAGATGAVAVTDGDVSAYLLGGSKPDPVWGPNVWVESAGHAATEPETMRDLYAVAATTWVDAGLVAHYALVPGYDVALVDAWFRLGFGLQHVHGIREVGDDRPTPPAAFTVRRAVRSDIPALAELGLELPRHQGRAPVFSAGLVPTLEETIAELESDLDLPDEYNVVAEHQGRVVGLACGVPLTKSRAHSGPARPDDAGFLGFAAVLPEARGVGAGRALGEAVIAWAADEGLTSVVTDWRATNLLSSRTWPRLGFRPSFLRLHRHLGY